MESDGILAVVCRVDRRAVQAAMPWTLEMYEHTAAAAGPRPHGYGFVELTVVGLGDSGARDK